MKLHTNSQIVVGDTVGPEMSVTTPIGLERVRVSANGQPKMEAVYTVGFKKPFTLPADVRWAALAEAPPRHGIRYVLCRCACGVEREVQLQAIRNGHSRACKSCGISTHGETSAIRHGKVTVEYLTWKQMRSRCGNVRSADYPDYGGRGIAVCDRWQTFENFLADMGRKPTPKHSVDRIDVNGNYEPGNVRWATIDEQARNKRPSAHAGKLTMQKARDIRALSTEGLTHAEIARRYGVSRGMIRQIVTGTSWREQ